ncbi:hypothetical protein BD779DRAFT_1476845 [Infundibulicybe gibba]|nr:hypothetical protein BD779DRAFT_1476845 [Infundibulicybe gibba]
MEKGCQGNRLGLGGPVGRIWSYYFLSLTPSHGSSCLLPGVPFAFTLDDTCMIIYTAAPTLDTTLGYLITSEKSVTIVMWPKTASGGSTPAFEDVDDASPELRGMTVKLGDITKWLNAVELSLITKIGNSERRLTILENRIWVLEAENVQLREENKDFWIEDARVTRRVDPRSHKPKLAKQ